MKSIADIKNLLKNPSSENVRNFFENECLIWVDWREYDEDIIDYVNRRLPKSDQIIVEFVDGGKAFGDDIVLCKDNQRFTIPYADDKMDRDTTLKAVAEFIKDGYDLRWFKESLGSDTLGFVVLGNKAWQELEEEFGKEKVQFYFSSVLSEKAIFEMGMDEMSTLMKERKIQSLPELVKEELHRLQEELSAVWALYSEKKLPMNEFLPKRRALEQRIKEIEG